MTSVQQQIIQNQNMSQSAQAQQNKNSAKTSSSTISSHQFLLLLTEQLKYQDPTNPMDNSQMLAQEAQFATLEQMEALTSGFTKFSSIYQANSLLGQEVEVTVEGKTTKGKVDYVDFSDSSGASISIGGKSYPLSSVSKLYPQDTTEADKEAEEDKNFFKEVLSYTALHIGDIASKLSNFLGGDSNSTPDTDTDNNTNNDTSTTKN